MVSDPADYPWSSYRVNALGVESGLCTPHPEYRALGELPGRLSAYRDLFTVHVEDELIVDIREAIEPSSALGDDRFIREMEARTGTRLRKEKPGPKPSAESDAELCGTAVDRTPIISTDVRR